MFSVKTSANIRIEIWDEKTKKEVCKLNLDAPSAKVLMNELQSIFSAYQRYGLYGTTGAAMPV